MSGGGHHAEKGHGVGGGGGNKEALETAEIIMPFTFFGKIFKSIVDISGLEKLYDSMGSFLFAGGGGGGHKTAHAHGH